MDLRWESIAYSDAFRSADKVTQNMIKTAWLKEVAPQAYPQMQKDPRFMSDVIKHVNRSMLPDMVEGEKDIIRPETLTIDGIVKMESNPEFARKSYAEQQALRDVWFKKMAYNDPEFQSLSTEEKDAYYKNALKRPPAYEVFSKHPISDNLSGFFMPVDTSLDSDLSVDPTKSIKGANYTIANAMHSFFSGFTSLVTGPVRLLAGEESAVANILNDIQKEHEWTTAVNTEKEFMRETVPNIVGFMGGLLAGPFPKLERGLAGASSIAKVGEAGAKKIVSTPGLFETVGTKLTGKIPTLGYRVAGGATAGALQGVSQAISEGKPWHSYLATDATLGVGFEFLSRYMGAVRQLRQVAKTTGIEIDDMLRKPFQAGQSQKFPEELTEILSGNAEMKKLVENAVAVDKDGMILRWMNSPAGVDAKSQMLGFDLKKVDDHYEVLKKGSSEPIRTFQGPAQKQIKEINDFLDTQDDAWEKALKGKTLYETVATSPSIQMRRAQFVPTKARKVLVKAFQENNVPISADYRVDPRGDTSHLDKIFRIVYDRSPKKASDTLRSLGIVFDESESANKAIVKNIKEQLTNIMPKEPYVFVNSKTKNVVDAENLPKVLVSNNEMVQPFYNSNVYSGDPRSIRNLINTIKSTERSTKSKLSKTVSGTQVQVNEIGNYKGYEALVKVPGVDNELHEVIIHFNTENQVYNFLRAGKYKGNKGFIESVFKGDDSLIQSYKQFEKAFKNSDPKKFAEESTPFQFVGKMAKDNGYHLGVYKGRYVLQDAIDPSDVRHIEFNRLQDAITFLRETPPKVLRPDLLEGVSDEAMEDVGLAMRDLLDDIPYEEVKRTRKYGISAELGMKFQPTQSAVNMMEKLEVVGHLRDTFDFSPLRIYNKIEMAHRARAAFEQQRRPWINKIFKGVKPKESEYMTDWIESLSDMNESRIKGVDYRLKSQVEDEMVKEFGRARADQLIEKAVEVEKFFDELFSQADMPWSSYIKHYAPHLGNQLSKTGAKLSTSFDVHSLTQIPETDRLSFIEMLRDVDPRDVVWERDLKKLTEVYNHIMARNLTVRPTMNAAKEELQHVLNAMKKNGATTDDYKAVANYMSNVMATIQGNNMPGDRRLKFAVERSVEAINESLEKSFGSSLKMKSPDPISKLITLATGAHLAARPYPILRNLTQMLTTGSFIGVRHVATGIDSVLKPGQLKRLMDMGVIENVMLPTGSGFSIDPKSIIAKGMTGYKWSDWINRAVVYTGTEARFDEAVELFKAGRISKKQFFRKSGMKLFGNPEFNEMARVYNTATDKDAALKSVKDMVASKAVAKTQYLYTRFDHPEAFRSSIGRLFGQYTTWPLNYYNFVKSMISSDSMSVIEKAGILGSLGAVTLGLARGAHEAGINPSSFLPWKMGILSPGPYFQMINDGLLAANGDRNAMDNFINNITSILPFVYEGEGIWKSAQALQDGDMYEALLHVMSAPVQYDLYPHRTTPMEVVRDAMKKGGQKYVQAQMTTPFEE